MKEQNISKLLQNQLTIPEKLLTSYNRLGLDEIDVMILLQIHRYLQKGHQFPTLFQLTQHLTISEEVCADKLRLLLDKNVIEIIHYQTKQGKISEAYSLEPLWKRLLLNDDEKENEEGKLFVLFEKEFGRPLSPFEIETINIWLDEEEINPQLIIAALREAVLMGKLNFKYIDSILREWKKKGVQSVEQAKQASEPFRKGQIVKTYTPEKRDTSVYFNWLEDGGL